MKIREQVVETIANTAAEVAYYDEDNVLIGYWAYGSWDPSLPYQGEPKNED